MACRRNAYVTYQHRDDLLIGLERQRNLEPHEVILVVKTPAFRIVFDSDPARTDYYQDDLGRSYGPGKFIAPIHTWP
jgi:hypothetical protein